VRGLYYHTKKIYHFGQSKPIFLRMRGKIVVPSDFPITFLHFLFKYGPTVPLILHKSMKKLDGFARGLVLCQSAGPGVPPGRNYKRVFVYHGTSDKIFNHPGSKLRVDWFDYYFLTGDKDLYKLQNHAYMPELLDDRIVKIGMFRSDSICRGDYDKARILKKHGIRPDGRRIVLYAPTWEWGGGTLNECFETFAHEIPKEHVLIVRPHYNDRKTIKAILEFQRDNRIEHLYIFPRQSQDIIDFICVSDLMIGDNSAVNYEFAMTKRPMVFAKSETKDVFVPPEEYNIKRCGPEYDPGKDSILDAIQEAFHNSDYTRRIARLVERSFYFNDGHAVDRACSFIVDTLSRMGIIDRDETLKKYNQVFEYRGDYV
jgi:CDP-glycerol glycerophosphotransferase (TagB/SpsB family)